MFEHFILRKFSLYPIEELFVQNRKINHQLIFRNHVCFIKITFRNVIFASKLIYFQINKHNTLESEKKYIKIRDKIYKITII